MSARDRRLLPLALNAIGVVAVAYGYFSGPFTARHGAWLAFACVFALITWATVVLLTWGLGATDGRGSPGLRRVRAAAILAGVAVPALTQAPTNAIHMAPLAVILVLAISDEYESVWLGAAAAVLAAVLTPIGCLIAHANVDAVLAYEAANAVWVLIGISRRQARTATRRNHELSLQQQTAREQEARASLLSARQAAARDIHDVLAHSLGGLVIQLDAAEALLESGRSADAEAKVAQARRLATEGLADARRAVAALRAPDESGTSEQGSTDLAGAVARVLRAHRELGGRVDASIELDPAGPIPVPVAAAFERALQEALSNARRHAPGQPVAATLVAAAGRLSLSVSNPIAPGSPRGGPRGTPDGGHGLVGMAERFAALPGGEAVVGKRDGCFVVRVQARLEETAAH